MPATPKRILVYKRTHDGDPDGRGEFGVQDCMGRVRGYGFDGFIGVGGVSAWPVSQGLDRKVNWVGRHPTVAPSTLHGARAPLLRFAEPDFALFEHNGPRLAAVAPNLAKRVYGKRLRYIVVDTSSPLYEEACTLIASLLAVAPSSGTNGMAKRRNCRVVRHGKACHRQC